MSTTGPGVAAGRRHDLATSFELVAADYARLRPEYPQSAVDLALAGVDSAASRSTVLDLGAGTGKLTGALVGRRNRQQIIAVEPLLAMLAELIRRYPQVTAVIGAAEHIPLAARSVDAVLVGQAFHWFDTDRALDEMARILRPNGVLSLLWNHDDERDPFVKDIEEAKNRAGRPVGGSTGRGVLAGHGSPGTHGSAELPFSGHPGFTDPALTEVLWQRTLATEDLIALINTYSYVIRASAAVRARLAAEVRAAADRHFPGRDDVTMPVACQVWRAVRR